jgi:hypothetical protein
MNRGLGGFNKKNLRSKIPSMRTFKLTVQQVTADHAMYKLNFFYIETKLQNNFHAIFFKILSKTFCGSTGSENRHTI